MLGNVLCDKMNNYLALYNTCSLISYVSSLILNATITWYMTWIDKTSQPILHWMYRLNSPIALRCVWENDLFLMERLLNSPNIAYKVLWCKRIWTQISSELQWPRNVIASLFRLLSWYRSKPAYCCLLYIKKTGLWLQI